MEGSQVGDGLQTANANKSPSFAHSEFGGVVSFAAARQFYSVYYRKNAHESKICPHQVQEECGSMKAPEALEGGWGRFSPPELDCPADGRYIELSQPQLKIGRSAGC